jgi:hypothetical protein
MRTGGVRDESPWQVERDRIALPEVQSSARRLLALLQNVVAVNQRLTAMLPCATHSVVQCATDVVSVPEYDAAWAESLAAEELVRKEHARLAGLLGLEPADIVCFEDQVVAHPDWYRNASEQVLIYQDTTRVGQPE